MRKAILLAVIPLLAVSLVSCEQSTGSMPGQGVESAGSARLELAPAEKALAAVSTAQAHRAVEHGGGRIVYHPGWSSRIAVVDAAGVRSEIYRQTRVYYGAYPREVVLGFRDVALAVFDPNHRIRGITVETLDGEVWSLDEDSVQCPPICPSDGTVPPPTPSRAPAEHGSESGSTALLCPPVCPEGTNPLPTPSRAPAAAPLDPARLALPAAERARASVSAGPQHRVAEGAGERATYHPGWSSRIRKTDALGRTHEIFRQTRVYHGAHPREVALGFRDVGLAVFDPNHRIRSVTVATLDGEEWTFDEEGTVCPPVCPEDDTPPSP